MNNIKHDNNKYQDFGRILFTVVHALPSKLGPRRNLAAASDMTVEPHHSQSNSVKSYERFKYSGTFKHTFPV